MRLGYADVSDLGFFVLQGFAQSDELSILAVHSHLQTFHLHQIITHVPVVVACHH